MEIALDRIEGTINNVIPASAKLGLYPPPARCTMRSTNRFQAVSRVISGHASLYNAYDAGDSAAKMGLVPEKIGANLPVFQHTLGSGRVQNPSDPSEIIQGTHS